jgi:hypothetical protein
VELVISDAGGLEAVTLARSKSSIRSKQVASDDLIRVGTIRDRYDSNLLEKGKWSIPFTFCYAVLIRRRIVNKTEAS